MFHLDRRLRRVFFLTLLAVLPFLALHVTTFQVKAEETKLPVPRFVSLDSNLINLRAGPGKEYPILWVYQRKGLPVEIIQEFDTWRRIRDHDGTIGWVQGNLLSGKRTVQIIGEQRAITRDAHGGDTVAYLDPGVVAHLLKCDESACRVEVQGYDGWLPRSDIWGTYDDEKLQGE